MELCQLLLQGSRQGHIFKLCQNDFFLSGEASREEAAITVVPGGEDLLRASREDTAVAARLLFGA